MSVKETSREALHDHRSSGKLGAQAIAVRDTVRALGSATRSEVSKKSNIPVNAISARVRELLDAKVLIVDGRKECTVTGRSVERLRLSRPAAASAECDEIAMRHAVKYWAAAWLSGKAPSDRVEAVCQHYNDEFRKALRAKVKEMRGG